MKIIIKNFIKNFCIIFDLLIFPFCLLAAIIFKIYRNLGVSNLNLTTRLLRGLGIFPIRNHYYEPNVQQICQFYFVLYANLNL
jgi:hypothetical protein